jgi:hypothetical protein
MHPELVEYVLQNSTGTLHTTRASLLRATKLYFFTSFIRWWGGEGVRPGLGIMRHEYIAH